MMVSHFLEILGTLLIIFAPPIVKIYGKKTSDYFFWAGLSLLGLALAFVELYIGAFLLLFFSVFNIIICAKGED